MVIAVDASPYSPALRVADKAYLVPKGLGDDFFGRVFELAVAHRVGLIVPTRDEELSAFTRRRKMFLDAGIRVLVADEHSRGLCQDKRVFVDYCIEHGFDVPQLLDELGSEWRWPVPSVDERLVHELATLSFVTDGDNLILLGPPGVGKSHLAVALGMRAIEAGFAVYLIRAHQLLEVLRRAQAEPPLDRRMPVYLAPKALIIKEFGMWRYERTAATAQVFCATYLRPGEV